MPDQTTHTIHGQVNFDVGDGVGIDGTQVKALRMIDMETSEEWRFLMDIDTAQIIGKGLLEAPAPGQSIAGLAVPASALGGLRG